MAEQALSIYGLEPASLTLLAHAFNTTFTVIGSDGMRYVLHILRPEEETMTESQRRARVESELWWLDRLRADLQLSVPVVVRAASEEGVVSIAMEGMAVPMLCTLFQWVDGRFHRHRLLPVHMEQVGKLTARLHDHSTQLRVPAMFDRPRVDAAEATTEEATAQLFADHYSLAAAGVMREVYRRVRRVQDELGSEPDAFGLIHADIHQKNYLFRRGDVHLIDFGDCGWGHYLYDLAVTISELEVFPHRAALQEALLAGYRAVRELSPAHEALLDTFVMLREAQNVTWFLKARNDPSYASRYTRIGERVAMLERRLEAAEG